MFVIFFVDSYILYNTKKKKKMIFVFDEIFFFFCNVKMYINFEIF